MSASSHYARLAGLQFILWVDGVALKGSAARFEAIRKVVKGEEFVWFAPARPGNSTWRGFKVPADLLPNGLATTVEISVGEDGERVEIPLKITPATASASGSVDLALGEDQMIASCIVKQKTVNGKGQKREHPYFTVTPRVNRPNSNGKEQVPNTKDEVFG
jgi:hypothetical protein